MSYLIMNRHSDTSRERLLEVFWPDADPDRARDSLKTALWSIRRCLRAAGVDPDAFLQSTKSTLRWIEQTDVDALRFAELATRDGQMRDAIGLFRGDFLEGDYDDWVVTERERLASLYESLLARVVRTSHDAEAAQLFIARNPYDEEAYVALIEAELAAGRRSSAASWVERCRKALAEVGDKPSDAFEARFGSVVHIEPVIPDELMLPFTGRDDELGLFVAKTTDAATGHGSLTLVHGEAGIGKSTLLDRFASIARNDGLRVVQIRGARDPGEAFGPWTGVFRSVVGGDFDAFAHQHGADIAAAIARELVSHLKAPSAFVVDDAHDINGDAFDVLIALIRSAEPANVVIVGSRPEGVAPIRARLHDLAFDEVRLGRLDRKNLRWALSHALGNEQPEVLDALYDRSGGHPLFFTGLLNALVKGGVLSRDGHTWRVTKPIDATIELPESVKRFIELRLQARGDVPRAVACALAIEPLANADDLAAVLKLDESATLDALDDLLALGLIVQPTTGAQFAFSHDLVCEVAAAGLNAGRRSALHRSFAQRLADSRELEAPLRLARHYQAAAELLPAAQAYLKAAQAALELSAAQAATDRCNAGIQCVEKLERSAARDLTLAQLQRTSARAAIAAGETEEAIRRARAAVAAARSAADVREATLAVLDLSVIEGAAFQVLEQQSDAAEASRSATVCGDEALARVQMAQAARQLGQRDEAVQAAQSAHELAQRSQRSDITVAALEELLLAHLTWWQFGEAVSVAREGLDTARRSSALVEAGLRNVRAALWYLLERFDDAAAELQAGSRALGEAAARHLDPLASTIRSLPALSFGGGYLAAKIANARGEWDGALAALDRCAVMTNVAKLRRNGQALILLRIDTLLQRNQSGDDEGAVELVNQLAEPSTYQDTIGWSDCPPLALARMAARRHAADPRASLLSALNLREENAHRAPLESDAAFNRLAIAAEEAGEAAVAVRARERSRFYRSRRRAAAGPAWGGESRG